MIKLLEEQKSCKSAMLDFCQHKDIRTLAMELYNLYCADYVKSEDLGGVDMPMIFAGTYAINAMYSTPDNTIFSIYDALLDYQWFIFINNVDGKLYYYMHWKNVSEIKQKIKKRRKNFDVQAVLSYRLKNKTNEDVMLKVMRKFVFRELSKVDVIRVFLKDGIDISQFKDSLCNVS